MPIKQARAAGRTWIRSRLAISKSTLKIQSLCWRNRARSRVLLVCFLLSGPSPTLSVFYSLSHGRSSGAVYSFWGTFGALSSIHQRIIPHILWLRRRRFDERPSVFVRLWLFLHPWTRAFQSILLLGDGYSSLRSIFHNESLYLHIRRLSLRGLITIDNSTKKNVVF